MIAAIGTLYGIAAAFVFRRMTDSRRIRRTVNRILAHIMEFGLFVDEPSLIWRAQGNALRANADLLRQIALPSVVMVAAFALLWNPMDRYFGRGPLPAGEAVVMTSRTGSVPPIDGVVVETPGVRVARTGEVSWRIRPVRAVDGGFPAGVEVRFPRDRRWLGWFIGFSTAGAIAAWWRLSGGG
jgi:hypothetical protein